MGTVRSLPLLLVLFFFSSQASAQQTLSGTVVDPLGAAVPGAHVVLVTGGQTVADSRSDEQGRFTFPHVDKGRYQLNVTADGFLPWAGEPFFAGSSGTSSITATLQIGLQQEVVVTATATETPASQVGSSITVIDHDTLATLAKPDVLEAIRLVPGATVVQTGARGGTTSLFVRGGASNFNKVLMDGVPANDIGGSVDFADIEATGVDRVEVLRDANSVLYGADALAGVISVTTMRGHARRPEVSLSLDGGNFNTTRQDGSLGGTFQRFDYFADVSHFATDNSIPNNAYRNKTVAGRIGVATGNGSDLSVIVRHSGGEAGAPNAVGLYGIPDDSSRHSDATYASATLQTAIQRRWQTTVRFASMNQGYHLSNASPTGQPFDPFGSGFPNYLGSVVTLRGANGYSVTGQGILDYGGVFPQLYDANTTRRSGYGQATDHLASWLDLSAGVRVDHEAGYTQPSGSRRSATTRTNTGAFTELRTASHRAFASAGLAYDHNALFKSAVTPRVSAALYLHDPSSTAAVGDTKATFNAGTGIKAASIYQELSSLYALAQGLPDSARLSVAGLPPIGPERNRSIDAGIEQGFWGGRARARASLFRNSFSDLIEYVSASILPQLGIPAAAAAASGYGAYVNSSSYWARGVETSGELAFGPMVHVEASYTHLHAVVTKSFASSALRPATNPAFPTIPIGQYGPLVGAAPFRRPANTASVLIAVTKGRGQAALAGNFVGKSDDSTFVSDGYFGYSMLLPNRDLDRAYQKVDLSGAYQLLPRLRWYISVENALNQRYQAAFGFPALPRSVRTGVTVRLGGDPTPRP